MGKTEREIVRSLLRHIFESDDARQSGQASSSSAASSSSSSSSLSSSGDRLLAEAAQHPSAWAQVLGDMAQLARGKRHLDEMTSTTQDCLGGFAKRTRAAVRRVREEGDALNSMGGGGGGGGGGGWSLEPFVPAECASFVWAAPSATPGAGPPGLFGLAPGLAAAPAPLLATAAREAKGAGGVGGGAGGGGPSSSRGGGPSLSAALDIGGSSSGAGAGAGAGSSSSSSQGVGGRTATTKPGQGQRVEDAKGLAREVFKRSRQRGAMVVDPQGKHAQQQGGVGGGGASGGGGGAGAPGSLAPGGGRPAPSSSASSTGAKGGGKSKFQQQMEKATMLSAADRKRIEQFEAGDYSMGMGLPVNSKGDAVWETVLREKFDKTTGKKEVYVILLDYTTKRRKLFVRRRQMVRSSSSRAGSPGAYSPGAYSPGAYSPEAMSPGAISPDASPGAASPGAASPPALSPGGNNG